MTRTHPGMAIPCMLCNSCNEATLSNPVEHEDEIIKKVKGAASWNQDPFLIRILKIREDGICIVQYITS